MYKARNILYNMYLEVYAVKDTLRIFAVILNYTEALRICRLHYP